MDGNISRRSTLKALGGITGAGLVGSVAFASSAAAANVNFDATETDEVVNDNGAVTFFNVGASGDFQYDGLDSPATRAVVTLSAKKVGVDGASFEKINSAEYSLNGTHGRREFAIGAKDLTEVFSDGYFSVDEDGSSAVKRVQLKLDVVIHYGDGNSVSASDEARMKLHVTNEKAVVMGDGEATGSAGGFDQSFESHNGEGTLSIRHGPETYTYLLDVSEWKDTEADGFNSDVDNWTIALSGLTVNGTEQAQVKYQDGEVIVKALQVSEDKWVGATNVPEDIAIEGSESGTLRLEVPVEYFQGSEYRVMCDASAGGNYHHLYISSTEGKGWSEGFDGGTENYIQVNASSSGE